MKTFTLFAAAILICGVSNLFAETVTGAVSGRWTLENSPYNVTGDLTIASGTTLEIEKDVEVLFDGNYSINVEGTLVTGKSGEERKQRDNHGVVFAASKSNRAGWSGIKFASSMHNSRLTNISLQDVNGTALYGKDIDLDLTNVSIHDNQSDTRGTVVFENSDIDMTNIAFSDNKTSEGGTLVFSGGTCEVTNASLSHNRGVGIVLADGAKAKLTNIAIGKQSGDNGWVLKCTSSEFQMTNGAIDDDEQGGIKLENNSRAKLTTCAVSGKNALVQDESSNLSSVYCAIDGK